MTIIYKHSDALMKEIKFLKSLKEKINITKNDNELYELCNCEKEYRKDLGYNWIYRIIWESTEDINWLNDLLKRRENQYKEELLREN